MNNFIRHIILGAIIGSYFSFVFYFLLSPGSGTGFLYIINWGIQGASFGALYLVLKLVITRIGWPATTQSVWIQNIISGLISGMILGIFLTLSSYSAIMKHDGTVVADSLKKMVVSDMLHVFIGYVLIGLTIGAAIAYIVNLNSKS